MLFALLAALVLGWLVWALFENGPSVAGIVIVVAILWALLDYGR